MRNKKPPFEITNTMIQQVAEIAELVGKLTSTNQLSANPTLRRINRIRTIHGSLAIEQNTLSLEQVTAVLNGKQVLALPKDIAEVKNAYEIYERLDELDPYSADDLLMAHGIMTQGLLKESGVFRSRPVGLVDQEGRILHIGTLPNYVPDLVMELFDWGKGSDIYMLIRSCVFHYELELIPPFADGNGRIDCALYAEALLTTHKLQGFARCLQLLTGNRYSLGVVNYIHISRHRLHRHLVTSNLHLRSTHIAGNLRSTHSVDALQTIEECQRATDAIRVTECRYIGV